jgi:hypothetical protein
MAMDFSNRREHAMFAIACVVAVGLACRSPTAPSTANARVTASQSVVRAGDTVTFVLGGYSGKYVQWAYFTTPAFADVSFVPVIVGRLGVPQTTQEQYRESVTFVRVGEAVRFTARASTPSFGEDGQLIAEVSIDVVR